MPHKIISNPEMDLDRSLGWFAVSWIEALCIHGNGDVIGQSVFPLTDEYARFIVMVYSVDDNGLLLHDNMMVSRSKGSSKSELAALIGIFDALGPARFDRWAEGGEVYVCPYGTGFTYEYQPGEPIGKRVTTPVVACIATEEGQAGEIYSTIYQNCRDGRLSAAFPSRDDVGLSRINLPGGGSIKPFTASGDSKDGGKNTCLLADECLSVFTPIPTPNGWKMMGDLELGDEVIGADLKPTRVIKATEPQHDRKCFEFRFSAGDCITASDGHLWATWANDEPLPRIRTSQDIFDYPGSVSIPRAGEGFSLEESLTRSAWEPIVAVRPIASVPVRCIAVDNVDHLFLAGPRGRVTHNTHLWKTPELHNAYATLKRNLAKRRKSAGGTFLIETTTMFAPGENSVAEQTFDLVDTIEAGKYKGRIRQLVDWRYSDITPEELDDIDRVREALIESYGETLAWNDLDGMLDLIMDTRSTIASSFRYYFNNKLAADSVWIAPWSWEACGPKGWDEDHPPPAQLSPRDQIVLGFDGSRGRKRGIADATALIACRVSDGYLFPIEVWEQPLNYHKDEPWMVPVHEVDAAVRATFKKYKVIGFWCDPAYWTPTIADWEARYGDKLLVKASSAHPCEYWTSGSGNVKKMVDMLSKFEDAVIDRELKHSGDLVPYGAILNQHIFNAHRRVVTQGVTIGKETANSNRKIDSAVAAAIAWSARLAAVAAGYGTKPKPRIAVKLR